MPGVENSPLAASGAAAASQSSQEAGSSVAGCPLMRGWVELELVDASDAPVADQRYVVRLPDGTTRKGKTDATGVARVEGFPEGICEICFPDLDKGSCEALGS